MRSFRGTPLGGYVRAVPARGDVCLLFFQYSTPTLDDRAPTTPGDDSATTTGDDTLTTLVSDDAPAAPGDDASVIPSAFNVAVERDCCA